MTRWAMSMTIDLPVLLTKGDVFLRQHRVDRLNKHCCVRYAVATEEGGEQGLFEKAITRRGLEGPTRLPSLDLGLGSSVVGPSSLGLWAWIWTSHSKETHTT